MTYPKGKYYIFFNILVSMCGTPRVLVVKNK
jgi:hypothetical protein